MFCVCVYMCVCVCARMCGMCISRVPNQNGVSPLYIMLEIHHSGPEPLICVRMHICLTQCFAMSCWLYRIMGVQERFCVCVLKGGG